MKLYDEVVPNNKSVDVEDFSDDEMYKQMPGGASEKNEVDMGMNASMLMPLIHAISAARLSASTGC